jgi:hypothetical protein
MLPGPAALRTIGCTARFFSFIQVIETVVTLKNALTFSFGRGRMHDLILARLCHAL